jgi:Short C-terminal domain
MIMRRRPLLRAAAVGGGAYAVGRHTARRSMARDQAESEQNDRLADLDQQAAVVQPVPAAAAPAAGDSAGSVPDQLDQLATLHHRGVLTDDEFTAAKAKLLGGDPLD